MTFVKKLRRIQTISSVIIFAVIFLSCWYVTKFNITEIQLSYWGVENNKLSPFWNITLMILAISMFFNVRHYIKEHKRMIYKGTIYFVFSTVFLSLFLTGMVTMDYKLHNMVAFYYFFVYPFSIFLLSHFNRKTIQYREWLGHLCFSIAMIISPLLFIYFFKGMAISEAIHSAVVLSWSLWILKHE